MSAGDLSAMDISTIMNPDPPGPVPLVDYGHLVDPDQTTAAGGNGCARTEITETRECTFTKTQLVALTADGLPGITLMSGDTSAFNRARPRTVLIPPQVRYQYRPLDGISTATGALPVPPTGRYQYRATRGTDTHRCATSTALTLTLDGISTARSLTSEPKVTAGPVPHRSEG